MSFLRMTWYKLAKGNVLLVVTTPLTPKKDGSWLMCIGCRSINKTITITFYMHWLDDMQAVLAASPAFFKIHRRSGYIKFTFDLGWMEDGLQNTKWNLWVAFDSIWPLILQAVMVTEGLRSYICSYLTVYLMLLSIVIARKSVYCI